MSELKEFNEQLVALRKAHEEGNTSLKNELNAKLDAQEEINQKKVAEVNAKLAKAEELEAKFFALEADVKRGNFQGGDAQAKTEELKSFEKFLVKGDLTDRAELKYLRTDSNERGGYLAPTDYVNEIIKQITEISPVRQVARVIPTSRKSVTIAKETGLPTFTWLGEGESITGSDATYGSEEIFTNKGGIKIEISQEMLDDSLFNMRSEISSMTAIKIAEGEGAAFINGTGVKQPEGLLVNSAVSEYNSGNATLLTADSLFGVQGEIKSGYNMNFMFNRRTLHQHIRTLKDGNGAYLLQAGLGSLPNTVAGLPYLLANDMPDVGAGLFPILCGDFRKAYAIIDNRAIRFKEDPYSSAGADKIVFYVFKRTGGQVVLPEAIKKIKISA